MIMIIIIIISIIIKRRAANVSDIDITSESVQARICKYYSKSVFFVSSFLFIPVKAKNIRIDLSIQQIN